MTRYVSLAILVLGAAFSLWNVVAYDVGAHLPNAAFALLIAIGLFFERKWTEHALFGVAIYVPLAWVLTVAYQHEGWKNYTLSQLAIGLIPGVLFSGFWIVVWLLVRNYFRSKVDHDDLNSHFS